MGMAGSLVYYFSYFESSPLKFFSRQSPSHLTTQRPSVCCGGTVSSHTWVWSTLTFHYSSPLSFQDNVLDSWPRGPWLIYFCRVMFKTSTITCFTFLNLCPKLGTTQLSIQEAHEHHTLWGISLTIWDLYSPGSSCPFNKPKPNSSHKISLNERFTRTSNSTRTWRQKLE